MILPSATPTESFFRATGRSVRSSDFRGVRPVEFSLSVAHMIEQPLVQNSAQRKVGGSLPSTHVQFSLRVAQRLERLPLTGQEVDGSSPSPQELACHPIVGRARQFPSVAIIDGHAPNGTYLRFVSHEFTALHQAADAVTGGNSL